MQPNQQPAAINDTTNPFFEHAVAKKTGSERLLRAAEIFAGVAFVIIISYLFVLVPHQVKGQSMEPNYHNDQILLVNQLMKYLNIGYARGDVIVLHKPGFEEALVKRVIGVPGDRISIKDGSFYINGNRLSESYIGSDVETKGGSFLREGEEKLVPNGYYFTSGDNRGNSLDSRFTDVGFVDNAWIKGKVILRVFPLSDFSFIGTGETSLSN